MFKFAEFCFSIEFKKKYQKRSNSHKPSFLDKMNRNFAVRPLSEPYKVLHSAPPALIITNDSRPELSNSEVPKVPMQRDIQLDTRIRINEQYPFGLIDIIISDTTTENFQLIFDVKDMMTGDHDNYRYLMTFCFYLINVYNPRFYTYYELLLLNIQGLLFNFPRHRNFKIVNANLCRIQWK